MRVEKLLRVDGEVAFVTGAASGVGLTMAETLAEQGATVIMTDIDDKKLNEAGQRMTQKGHKVQTAVLDVSRDEKVMECVKWIVETHGRLDICCANAGISAGSGPRTGNGQLAEVEIGKWREVVNLNLTSVFVTIKSVSRQMEKQRSGRIIVTGSIAGLRAEPMCGYAYAATKAGVINLVRQAVLELSEYDIRINAIAPGPFLTNIGEGRMRKKSVAERFAAAVPLGRIGHLEEMKGLIALLASQGASYINGAIIPIDGGVSAV